MHGFMWCSVGDTAYAWIYVVFGGWHCICMDLCGVWWVTLHMHGFMWCLVGDTAYAWIYVSYVWRWMLMMIFTWLQETFEFEQGKKKNVSDSFFLLSHHLCQLERRCTHTARPSIRPQPLSNMSGFKAGNIAALLLWFRSLSCFVEWLSLSQLQHTLVDQFTVLFSCNKLWRVSFSRR